MTLAAKPEHVELGEWLAHQGKHFNCAHANSEVLRLRLMLRQLSNSIGS